MYETPSSPIQSKESESIEEEVEEPSKTQIVT